MGKNKSDIEIEYVNTDDLKIYRNDFERCAHEYCEHWDIENLHKATQSQFNGYLIYCKEHILTNIDTKSKDREPITNNTGYTNHNRMNYELLDRIVDQIYIPLCMNYSKEASINGFCFLTGLKPDSVMEWKHNDVTSPSYNLYKKIVNMNEETLSDIIVSGRCNPMGALAKLNRYHTWNGAGTVQTAANNKLSLNDIKAVLSVKDEQQPRLTIPDNTQNS